MKVYNSSKAELLNVKFNILLVSSGYEERCISLCELLDLNTIPIRVAFIFETLIDSKKSIENRKWFKENGFEEILLRNDSPVEIVEFLNSIEYYNDYNILIDYSSMSRKLYLGILSYFHFKESRHLFNLYFSYTIPKFIQRDEQDILLEANPLASFINLGVPSLPTALIIGLGDNKYQPMGLKEYFDAEMIYLWICNSKFKDHIINENGGLIELVGVDNLLLYSLREVELTYYLLHKLSSELAENYSVVIAPCGPKPFTLVSAIVALNMANIDLWYISKVQTREEEKAPTTNRELVVCRVCY